MAKQAYFDIRFEGMDRVLAKLQGLSSGQWHGLTTLMGQVVQRQTVEHFQMGAGPDGAWAALKHRSGQILVDTGALMGSIHYQARSAEVEIGTGVHYGKYHQYGAKNLPQRQFLGLTGDDEAELKDEIIDYMERLLNT